eukprot:scaffold2424_cov97-Cylindrotheca_fusiformis.AAC.1
MHRTAIVLSQRRTVWNARLKFWKGKIAWRTLSLLRSTKSAKKVHSLRRLKDMTVSKWKVSVISKNGIAGEQLQRYFTK